jgi:hypothetical protein
MKRTDQLVVGAAVTLGLIGLVTGVGHAFGGAPRADDRGVASAHHVGWSERDCHHGWHGRTLFERYDGNDDSKLTQDEVDAALARELGRFDADGDGMLALAEYEPLWLERMREEMVDRFQALDRDGDAKVTREEYTERTVRLVERLDANGDGELTSEELRGWMRGHYQGSGKPRGQEL